MKTMNLGRTNLRVPVIGLGCMRITELGNHQNVRKLIDTARLWIHHREKK